MYQLLKSNILKILLLFLFTSFWFVESYACDKNVIGVVVAPNNVINSGEIGCVTGDFTGAVTVNPGGILRICGQFTFTGSINVSGGGKIVITAGSSIGVVGSLNFNGFESLEYSGDPACNAEIYAVSANSCFVTWGAVPGLSGRLCNSSNVYLDAFVFAWGTGTRGLANLGRAPFLCPNGGNSPCVTLLMNTLEFDANLRNLDILLEWSVIDESNIDFFTIEKSVEGFNWESIAILPVEPQNSNINAYSFIDKQPFRPGTYYRVRQTSLDKESILSSVKYVSVSSKENNFSIFPNPSEGKFNLSFNPSHNFEKYSVINQIGCVLTQGIIEDNSIQEIDLSKLQSGVYVIIVSGDNTVSIRSIVISNH